MINSVIVKGQVFGVNGVGKLTDDVYEEVLSLFPESEWTVVDVDVNGRGHGIATYEVELRRDRR